MSTSASGVDSAFWNLSDVLAYPGISHMLSPAHILISFDGVLFFEYMSVDLLFHGRSGSFSV